MKAASLIRLIRCQGLEPQSYSGRGMFGRECVGVVVESLGQYELPKGWSWDNMGLQFIVYWPNVDWPKERNAA